MANHSDELLLSIINHVTLPPRLPGKGNIEGDRTDAAIASEVTRTARAFRDLSHQYNEWTVVCQSLENFRLLHGGRHLSKDELVRAFADVSAARQSHLIIHVATQNAGLLIRKEAEGVVFEAFEASAQAASVLEAKNALQWDFPSHAVTVPLKVFANPAFQQATAGFLEQCSLESVKHFAATTAKAGSNAYESRDRSSPVLIGRLLMAVLEACGRPHAINVTRKRVRDDVCWTDGAKDPWRRSAAWLVLRVGIQRSLAMLLGGVDGLIHYKVFVAFHIAELCDQLTENHLIHTEYLAHVRTKLARRLAKLQSHLDPGSTSMQRTSCKLFTELDRKFTATLDGANSRLASEWTRIRTQSKKLIPRLPKRAEEASLVLSLRWSYSRLWDIFQNVPLRQTSQQQIAYDLGKYRYAIASRTSPSGPDNYEPGFYSVLAKSESDLLHCGFALIPLGLEPCDGKDFAHLASQLTRYIAKALPAYLSSVEQISMMLLTTMEAWVSLDKMALRFFPLLIEYKIEFPIECLHVLQLSRLQDLSRLRAIETHLDTRHQSARAALPSVFSNPSHHCFAVRYFDQCSQMQETMSNIKSKGESARALKKGEWEKKSADYEGLLKRAGEKSCLYFETQDQYGNITSKHDYAHCGKHQLELQASKMRISIHEDPLPDSDDAAKSAIFELLCPREFAIWRDVTWNIINILGRKTAARELPPKLFLRDYTHLREYHCSTGGELQMASHTKSFLNTHYAIVSFPVALDQVCLPNGLRLGLYDPGSGLWTAKQVTKPSFAELCSQPLPTASAFAPLNTLFQTAAKMDHKPSANEIIASQTDCPNTLTPFEYLAFQDLLHGTKLRWVQLLRELSSPTLNFGTVSMVLLVTQVALQVGAPGVQGPLRVGHWVFEDAEFCATVGTQIKKRLDAIETNWREGQTLECLTTLLQQIWHLGRSQGTREQAAFLLRIVRTTALGWLSSLRREILAAADSRSAQMRSKDALLTALICRRTYILERDHDADSFDSDSLACFIEASIVMNDNTSEKGPGWISRLSNSLRNMVLRDVRLVGELKRKLRSSISSSSPAIDRAMNNVWPQTGDTGKRSFSRWEFGPEDDWITAHSIATSDEVAQTVHYNVCDGTLLINNEQLGRLPEDFTKDPFFVRLLGDRLYRSYPSAMIGMSCMLAAPIEGNRIHFGFRNNAPFMRAQFEGQIFELIRPEVFCDVNGKDADLPVGIIRDHVHWLELHTGLLHITPEETMWRSKRSDWILDIHTRRAIRRETLLVDVRSNDFQKIAAIVEPFEDRSEILVYQPPRRNLTVKLSRLEAMTFEVNSGGLLQSRYVNPLID